MTTKYNLTIDSRSNEGDPMGNGVSQNTSVRSDDPNELIALLQKLAGLTQSDAHAGEQSPAAGMRMTMQKSGLGALPDMEPAPSMACSSAMLEDQLDEALANAPRPKTMKDLLDLVPTNHTAKAPTEPVPAKSADNPLTDSKEELLESKLQREWTQTKVQNYVESFDELSACVAIAEGRDSFVIGTKEYAIRKSDNHKIVYPIVNDRVMTQVPIYVTEEYMVGKSPTDVKHLAVLVHNELEEKGLLEQGTPDWNDPDTKKFYDQPAAQRMASGKTKPVDNTDYDTPPELRPDRPTSPDQARAEKLGKLYGRPFGKKPEDETTPDLLRKQAGESVNEAKKKKAKNKYAIGMAAAMNATGDKPPLKKSTITKAHKIADKIKEGSKKK